MKDFESQQFRDDLAKTIKQAPKDKRRDILDEARKETEKVNEEPVENKAQIIDKTLEELIRNLMGKELTDEERQEIEGKVFDIFDSPDTILHITKANYLLSILKSGLLSLKFRWRILVHNAEQRYAHYGRDDDHTPKNAISVTTNKNGEAKKQMLSAEIEKRSDFPMILHLIYSKESLGNKIKDVKGVWPDEIFAHMRVGTDHLKGLALDKDTVELPLTGLVKLLKKRDFDGQKDYFEWTSEDKKWDDKQTRKEIKNAIEPTKQMVKRIIGFFKDIGVEFIGGSETDNHSIYKINIKYNGNPITITKEYGYIKIVDDNTRKQIADSIRNYLRQNNINFSKSSPECSIIGFELIKDFFKDILKLSKNLEVTDEVVVDRFFTETVRFIRASKFQDFKDPIGLEKGLYEVAEWDEYDGQPERPFEYTMSSELSNFLNFLNGLQNITGDIPVEELLKLIAKEFLIPIYVIDKEKKNFRVVIP